MRECSSFCNVESMRKAAFHCYYILQPSNNGVMDKCFSGCGKYQLEVQRQVKMNSLDITYHQISHLLCAVGDGFLCDSVCSLPTILHSYWLHQTGRLLSIAVTKGYFTKKYFLKKSVICAFYT
ncbi:hypothetical protein LWI29_003226 [Acer saccharum]|uniref:Uncharacterized protein n=1 Tax=Acer saccharum TaxID=4024 RepID=A0AA39TA50_ACESA|nr:hypothetical protein LWI29_003226 [Acer saccharum]